MIRAVLWKEWREQASIIVALLALGAGVIAAATMFGSTISDTGPLDFRGYGEAGRLAFLMLALTAGTVIGGTLFAGEDEAGTSGYLESLPASRMRMWRGKVLAGLILAAGAGAVLIAEGILLGALGSGRPRAGWAMWSAVLVLTAFGWGTFGSVQSRSTLTACGIGVIAAPLAGGVFITMLMIGDALVRESGFDPAADQRRLSWAMQATAFFLLCAPLALSALIYSSPDRARRGAEMTPGAIGSARSAVRENASRRSGFGLRALFWLLMRQYFLPVLILGGLAVVAGSIMLADETPMIVGWPAATLIFGVLAGVIGWSDEQGRGAAQFWGERRLPIGRLWFAKLAIGFAVTLGLSLVYLLPSLIRESFVEERRVPTLIGAFRSGLLTGDLGIFSGRSTDASNFLYFLFLWPVYGFAFGHLAGLLFKKAIVAAGVGVLVGGTFAALWLPSFFAGGLHHWQLWPVPVIVVLTARLLMRPWSANRIGTRRPIAALTTGAMIAIGLTAFGIGWRVAEVPVIAEANDDLDFVATVPTFEQNLAGREIRSAAGLYQMVDRSRLYAQTDRPLFPDDPESSYTVRSGWSTYQAELNLIPKRGWPVDRPDLDAWMEDVFSNKWDATLYEAAKLPVGVIEDPTAMTIHSGSAMPNWVGEMSHLVLARGLQKQAQGDPAAFVRHLDAVLAVARNARNKSYQFMAHVSRRVEYQAFTALDQWLERLDGRPDLLQKTADVVRRHAATVPTNPNDVWHVSRTMVRNTVTAPSSWAEKYLSELIQYMSRRTRDSEAVKMRAELEASLLGFAWAVPWERERLRRVVGLGNDPKQQLEIEELTRGAPGLFTFPPHDLSAGEPVVMAARRAAVIRVSLRLFEAEAGKPADRLDQLVPRYLPAVPADPFDGKPFRYRLSAGESLHMEAIQTPQTTYGEPAILGPGWSWDGEQKVLTQGEFDAMAAGMGGLVRFPRLMREPPGIELPSITDEGFDAVGAIAGGIIQWPLTPLTPAAIAEGGRFPDDGGWPAGSPIPLQTTIPPEGAGGPVGGGPGGGGVSIVRAGLGPDLGPSGPPESPRRELPPGWVGNETRRVVEVAPGQGILWSIGTDLTDDGGKDLAIGGYRGSISIGDLIYVVPMAPGKKLPPKKEK